MSQPHNENYNEQPMTRMGRIQQPSRRYRRLRHPSFTAAIWTANNPLLQRGEIGSEIDTGKLKIGDGVTYWNDLGYVAASEIAFADITGTPDDNVALKNALDAKQDVLTEGTGIDIDSDNVISNTGVRSVATGTTNGTISVNTGGTSAEVAVYGLGSAAYTSSSDYATAAQGILADNAANKDLSNLSNVGKNISNWSTNVTNCITEIPQDIKLELSSGTLTLKAGSKVTYPDGTQITISTDETISTHSTNGEYVCARNKTGGAYSFLKSLCYSGTTAPTGFSGNALWLDTTNNIIKHSSDSGATWVNDWSFPVGIATSASSAYTSIDQVFNGFGYIGSTIFALPGVKGIIPNGRNADGTLNNTAFSITQVKTATYTTNGTYYIRCATNYINFFTSTTKYDPITNYNIYNNANNGQMMAGTITISGGVITLFNPKPVFHAVDYNDTEYIAHQAMPSDKYVNLTLPASGGTITAPADGYLTVIKGATSSGLAFTFTNTNNNLVSGVQSAGAINCRCFIPASKGDIVRVDYSLDGTTSMFRFVYANGAK